MTKTRRTRVYVAGPITLGDRAANIRTALSVTDRLIGLGYAPYCPHLTHFQQLMFPREYEDWMSLDFEWLPLCDALLRLPGESKGAGREVALAKELGIPIFHGQECFTRTVSPQTSCLAPTEPVDERKTGITMLIGRRVCSSVQRRHPLDRLDRRNTKSRGRRGDNRGRAARGTREGFLP